MRTTDQAGFGIPGMNAGEAVEQAQRYWQAWSDAMRAATGAGAPAAQQDMWQSAMTQWSQLARALRGETNGMGGMGGMMGGASPFGGDAFDRMAQQSRQWFGKMQEVAGQFAGRPASAEDVAGAWRRAMGGGENPFAAMFAQMQGPGQSGFDQWYRNIAPWLQQTVFGGNAADATEFASRMTGGFRDEGRAWLNMPAYGPAREQQERWQAFAQAHLDLQEANDAYNTAMLQAGRDAFDRFERKLAERSEPGRQLQSARALFDLWIDAAEEAYADIALSTEFRRLYADLVNAQMRVRAGVQREVEALCGQFGMPTRTEIDSAHRKIAELERELRRQRSSSRTAANASATQPVRGAAAKPTESAPAPAPKREAAKPAAAKPAAVKPAAKKSADAKRSGAKSSVQKTSVQKPAASKPVPSKSAAKPVTKSVATAKVAAKSSRATTHATAKRSARPSIAMAMPEAPKPITASNTKTAASTKSSGKR